MSKKLKRILAIIALVFVGLFTVCFIAFLFFPDALNGSLSYASLVFGGFGLVLFFVVKFTGRGENADGQAEPAPAPEDSNADVQPLSDASIKAAEADRTEKADDMPEKADEAPSEKPAAEPRAKNKKQG